MTPAQIEAEIQTPLSVLPAHLQRGLRDYFVDRVPTGDFLRAVLANDFAQAVLRADPESFADLRAIALFIVNVAPAGSHGSYAAVDDWLAGGTA